MPHREPDGGTAAAPPGRNWNKGKGRFGNRGPELSPGRAMNRLGIYEQEALVNRGMTQAELEVVKLSNKVSDEDKDFVMLDKNDPGDGSVIHIGVPWMSFDEQVQSVLDSGEQAAEKVTLNVEDALSYAAAFNNALSQEEIDEILSAYEAGGGKKRFAVSTEKVEGAAKRYDNRLGWVNGKDEQYEGMCAAYAGGILREGGFELNDYSLQSVDCLYKELSGGEYKNPKRKKHFVFDPHPGVKGKIVLDDKGPLAQQDTLTVEQQYEKLLATGVVSAGDVIFVTHDRKGKDISHVMIVNGTDESEIRYCGETTARYDHPLSAYIEGERKNNRKPHIEIFLLHK
ncbi:MAG: amidase domain-containing protein [Clostridia bacterium]|nr:amidase domain-containing protein [Clostridia bacterium]